MITQLFISGFTVTCDRGFLCWENFENRAVTYVAQGNVVTIGTTVPLVAGTVVSDNTGRQYTIAGNINTSASPYVLSFFY